MKVGPDELTTEEEWCSEYQFFVQKSEGAALAFFRHLNTHGKPRWGAGLLSGDAQTTRVSGN